MDEKPKNNRKVDWRIFTWVISIIFITTAALWAAYARVETKVNFIDQQYVKIQQDLREVLTNIEWIKEALRGNK